MSYRCHVCDAKQPPRTPRKVHAFLRPDGTIRTEIAVCNTCASALAAGATVQQVRRELNRVVQPAAVTLANRPVMLGTPAVART